MTLTSDSAVLDLVTSAGNGDVVPYTSYPLDSSRVLLGLVNLVRRAERDTAPERADANLCGLISPRVFRSLLNSLLFRDPATLRHSQRVGRLATGLAKYLGWEDRNLRAIQIAALLHDLGKVGVPDSILFKPARLNSDELRLMTKSYLIGVDLLEMCRVDPLIIRIITDSHHRYSREPGANATFSDIHQGARILVVADAYESLSNDQVFRRAKAHDEILKLLNENAGTQFDGNIVSALQRWIHTYGPPALDGTMNDDDSLIHYYQPASDAELAEAANLSHLFSYLQTLDELYDGFSIIDCSRRMLVWNRGAVKTHRRPAREVLNTIWKPQVFGYADDRGVPLATSQCPLEAIFATGSSYAATLNMTDGEGEPVSVELQAFPLIDRNQRLQAVAEIYRRTERDETSHVSPEVHALKMMASRDALTRVANRGELDSQIEQLLKKYNSESQNEVFSVIFVDADHFKSINDKHGHTVGDQVLVELARLLQHESYSGEIIGRYGGEEFIVLCPATDVELAVRKSERFRMSIQSMRFADYPSLRITASFGVSQVVNGDTVASLVERADKALYQAKQTGRNRTCHLMTTDSRRSAHRFSTDEEEDPLRLIQRFYIGVGQSVVPKMAGFVEAHRAKLLVVEPGRVKMQCGQGTIFGMWGWTNSTRPVILEIVLPELVEEQRGHASRRGPNSPEAICVTIQPKGRPNSQAIFQNRAKLLMQDLKSYLVPCDRQPGIGG
ncbi:diguanylate cyclase [Planctopirus limnophila]|uniref:diguanylate cyclase n=1 Tax=Planctopirus limnophila TaxID=120 RepID=UPI0001A2F6C0|nr:diguanylate cyclase [Planctopirus limnophila]